MEKGVFQARFFGIVSTLGFFLAGCATVTTADFITVDSATLQNVVRVTDNGLRKDGVIVSPDGTKILYCESDISNVNGPVYSTDYKVMLLRDANLSNKTPLVTSPSFGPVWFSDNSQFIYVTYEGGNSQLVRSNISGGGKTYITRNAIGDFDARPAIRGHNILCDTLINGVRHLVSLQDDGTLITILGQGEQPSWHPDGTKFVFIKDGSICEMDLKTNQVTQLYAAITDKNNNAIEFCRQPSYSKDGKYILFAKGANIWATATVGTRRYLNGALDKVFSSKTNIETRRWHIFLVNANGTGLTQLTSGNVDVFSPSWGINNDIYFISNVQNAQEIWKARLLTK